MKSLAEKIIKIIDAETLTVDEKMISVKQAAIDEVRMQALKAFPAKAKLASTLTKMYKDNAKTRERYTGYVKLDTGFALTDSYYLVRVFDSSPAELLPNSAEEIKGFTTESINRLFTDLNTDLSHDVTVSYSDVIAHIKMYGRRRNKKNLKNLIFSVPNTGVRLNVLYLEYAFKLAQDRELKVKIVDNKHLIYVQGNGWDMLICPITQNY